LFASSFLFCYREASFVHIRRDEMKEVREINKYIVHTLLAPEATVLDIQRLCVEAVRSEFAGVCVPPQFIRSTQLYNVRVATICAFPLKELVVTPEEKARAARKSLLDGAEDIGVCLSVDLIKQGKVREAENEICLVARAIEGKLFTVGIDMSSLNQKEKEQAVQAAGHASANFICCMGDNITPGDVALIRAVRPDIGVKVLGVSTYIRARTLIIAGAAYICTAQGIAITREAK
jgi:deoxyribose-phosphate aldolase